ncbi:MAG UNVERIFIED_CONTAM: DUF2924 domain-containing protein [Planctomycetaceae bacterium]
MVGTVESPAWLSKRIAWRMQANHEGGRTEHARQRARELACDADLRLAAPRLPTTASVSSRDHRSGSAMHRAAASYPPAAARNQPRARPPY